MPPHYLLYIIPHIAPVVSTTTFSLVHCFHTSESLTNVPASMQMYKNNSFKEVVPLEHLFKVCPCKVSENDNANILMPDCAQNPRKQQ